MNKKLPTYFVSHGGGPWPWLKEEMPFYGELEKSLKEIPRHIGVKPKALLVVSGHWEENEFTVMASPNPPMIYDYGGFPEHTYKIQYPALGAPDVAKTVQGLIQAQGIKANLDSQRGFDHGTYAPVFPMYPNADVPVLQLSMKKGYNVEEHYRVGQALAPLRSEGILIMGSGLSYHNLRAMFAGGPQVKKASKEFDEWLQETLLNSTGEKRLQNLLEWAKAPSARIAHPREDHLIPLMVAAGAAENEKAHLVYHEETFMNDVTASSFRFGD